MNHSRRPTTTELALLGLTEESPLPAGGHSTYGVYFTRTSTSHFYVDDLSRELGTHMFRGSLNLRLCEAVVLLRPRQLSIAQEQWEAVPVILNESAVGVHAWKHAIHDQTYLEIFAPIKLVPVLALENGDRVAVRMLPGSQLHTEESNRDTEPAR